MKKLLPVLVLLASVFGCCGRGVTLASRCEDPEGCVEPADAGDGAMGSDAPDVVADNVVADSSSADTVTDAASDAVDGTVADAGRDALPDMVADTPILRRCDRVEPGSLIRGTGSAVYYIAWNHRRYVFPNVLTYYSWYDSWTLICRVTDEVLASIAIGGNVTIRPGTYIIKITTDPKVYAITAGGVLHWIESESLAESLYGSAWNRRVRDVADAWFVNYSVGRSVGEPRHPDGTLVAYAAPAGFEWWQVTYLIDHGERRPFASAAAFEANRFRRDNVVQTTITYPSGPVITGNEPRLSEPIQPSEP